jgi:hypothetical protein
MHAPYCKTSRCDARYPTPHQDARTDIDKSVQPRTEEFRGGVYAKAAGVLHQRKREIQKVVEKAGVSLD